VHDVILESFPLGRVWPTADPFLFCVHHDDDYPPGDEELGPIEPLIGRSIGADFSGRDGWSMYHGSLVPGFPQHPHRGFETISFMRRGLMDHSDSLGAAARFGRGDVQWMTAGGGIVHAEMFPLLSRGDRNPLELFQIWINLPQRDKMVPPHFAMLWDRDIPKHVALDREGRATRVTVIAGAMAGQRAPNPPPNSWASHRDSDVAIWHLELDPGTSWTLPSATHRDTNRVLYVFGDGSLRIGDRELASEHGALIRCDVPVTLTDTGAGVEALVLQGRPIGEPVVQYGPFVMTDQAGIQRAYADYQETGFGGWPWHAADPNHGATRGRFARHADGRDEAPDVEPEPAPDLAEV
jgi:redox-sensitive bicupin YhaK (pirin superfamily)